MATSPIVTNLPAYVEEKRLPLITKALIGAKTAGLINLETGVKSKTALNILTTDVVFGDGAACGWNEAGSATLSQRYIDPAFLSVNMGFCDKKLLGKYASYQVNVAAGRETMPFEESFIADVIDQVNAGVEKMIWTGDSTQPNQFDGFVKILSAVGSGAITVAEAAGDSVYARIQKMYAALPAEVVGKDDVAIFVSDADYRAFIQELVAANLYHFNPDYKNGEYMLPGTSVRVIAVAGLNGSAVEEDGHNVMVAGRLSNMYYGCAAEDDKDSFDFWYSKDNREFRLAIEFAAGVQVAFPDQMAILVAA